MIRKINNVFARIESPCDEQAAQNPSGSLIYLDGIKVDAGRIKVGDTICIRAVILKSGTALSCVARLYWNTTINTSGATQLGQVTISASARHCAFNRRIHFSSSSIGVSMKTTYDTLVDIGDFPTQISTTSITNWLNTNGYFFITIDATGRTSETLRTLYISVEI